MSFPGFVFVLIVYWMLAIFVTSPRLRTLRKLLVSVPITGFFLFILYRMVAEVFK